MDAVDWHCAVDLVGRHWTVPERHPVRRYGSRRLGVRIPPSALTCSATAATGCRVPTTPQSNPSELFGFQRGVSHRRY